MNNVAYEMDAASFVFCGTYDYSFDMNSMQVTEIVNLTESTSIDGELHTASWKAQGGSTGASTTDIIVDGVELPDMGL